MVLLLVLSGDDGLVVFNVGKMLLQSVVYIKISSTVRFQTWSFLSPLCVGVALSCGCGTILGSLGTLESPLSSSSPS